tara:strand:- start:6167 stop:7072 length:906 start_codon:yes stop_codon:yes gene_type:complete
MKRLILSLSLALPIAALAAPPAASPQKNTVELTNQQFLFEVIQYLYRWYLDEDHAQVIVEDGEAVFLVRENGVSSDPDDQSRFGTIVLPQLGYTLSVKKADYRIEELDIDVHSDVFEIVNVTLGTPDDITNGFESISIDYESLIQSAHQSRGDTRFPEGELLSEMVQAAKRKILEHVSSRKKAGLPVDLRGYSTLEEFVASPQEIHLAPHPDVANDVWIYWETGQMLLHFSSELDLNDPQLWSHQHLSIKLYDIDEQTVVSLHEVAGSNAYLTRDQVGRILYNCLVLGKRVTIDNTADAGK